MGLIERLLLGHRFGDKMRRLALRHMAMFDSAEMFLGFRHESRITSPPIWAQNLMLPPLWALAKLFGIRPYHDHWDSRTRPAGPDTGGTPR